MIDLEGTRNVSIGGNVYHVKVRRKSDSAWVAMGEFEGEVLTAEATSREAAVKRWREMAEPRVRTRSGERRPNRRTAGPAPRQQTQLRELGPDDYDVSQGGRDIGAQLQSPVLRCPSTCPACGLSVAQCSRRV